MARPNTLPGAEQELVAGVTVAMKEAETEEVVTEEVVMAAEATRRTALIRDDPDYFGFCG